MIPRTAAVNVAVAGEEYTLVVPFARRVVIRQRAGNGIGRVAFEAGLAGPGAGAFISLLSGSLTVNPLWLELAAAEGDPFRDLTLFFGAPAGSTVIEVLYW